MSQTLRVLYFFSLPDKAALYNIFYKITKTFLVHHERDFTDILMDLS